MQTRASAATVAAAVLSCLLAVPSARADEPRRVVTGVLSRARRAAPEQIARSFIAAHPDLVGRVSLSDLQLEQVTNRAGGAFLRFGQQHRGLDVIGGAVAVRLDELGRVRWVLRRIAPIDGRLSTRPSWSASNAIVAALVATGATEAEEPDEETARGMTRLAILASRDGSARLVWDVVLPPSPLLTERLRARVDAQTGIVRSVENMVVRADHHLANVYEVSPGETPETSVVALGDLPEEATRLAGPELHVLGCPDRRECRPAMVNGRWRRYHSCTPDETARTNADGDFLDIVPPADVTDPTDSFAEVNAYYQLARTIEQYRAWLGDPGWTLAGPLTVVVNARVPVDIDAAECTGATAPESSVLGPLNLAAVLPGGDDPWFFAHDRGDWIVFGQSVVDLAYETGFTAHELSHAALFRLSGLSPAGSIDERGSYPSGSVLHEALAEYFAAASIGDGSLNDWVRAHVDEETRRWVVDVDNEHTCPVDLVGEAHYDGFVWDGALWAIRQSLPEVDRADFDASVLTASMALGELDGPAELVAAILAELEVVFGAPVRDAAATELEARGLPGCNDRIVPLPLDAAHHAIVLSPTGNAALPGPLQLRVELAEEVQALRVHARRWYRPDVVPGDGLALTHWPRTSPSVVAKPGDEPIVWTSVEDGLVTSFTHDAPLQDPVALDEDGTATARIVGPLPAGPVFLQLVAFHGAVVLVDVTVSVEPDASPDAGPDADGGPDAGPTSSGPAGGGCSCRATGAAGGAPWWTALVAVAIALPRRRSRCPPFRACAQTRSRRGRGPPDVPFPRLPPCTKPHLNRSLARANFAAVRCSHRSSPRSLPRARTLPPALVAVTRTVDGPAPRPARHDRPLRRLCRAGDAAPRVRELGLPGRGARRLRHPSGRAGRAGPRSGRFPADGCGARRVAGIVRGRSSPG